MTKYIPLLFFMFLLLLAPHLQHPSDNNSTLSEQVQLGLSVAKVSAFDRLRMPEAAGFLPLTNTLTVKSNAEWTPVIKEFDSVLMALVPRGCFMMGSAELPSVGGNYWHEQPVHEVCIEVPFWIDVYEVTNAQFGSLSHDALCRSYSFEEQHPRNCVSWYAAQSHCKARSGSLPTEAQWEYAARGPDGLLFPWGNQFMADWATYRGNSNNNLTTVGSYPEGMTWIGTYDMAGNVAEWTTTIYSSTNYPYTTYLYPYNYDDGREDLARTDVRRIVRGGSFYDPMLMLRSTDRDLYDVGWESSTKGFRCVRHVKAWASGASG